MVKLAIRDDDTNYFTKVSDLEGLINDLGGFPVSFAVIPTVTDVSTFGACSDTKGNTEPKFVGENKELVSWLKNMVSAKKCDILLHGITHGYKFAGGTRLPEMVWRADDVDISKEIGYWKANFTQLFEYEVSCFVAPSNIIVKKCIDAVANNNLNFSGIIPINFQRKFTFRNIANYFARWYYRVKDKVPYPGVLTYSDHKEINACTLRNVDYLIKMYDYCDAHNLPMVINTHYWSLRDNDKQRTILLSFMKYAKDKGMEPILVSDLMK